jgi:magnesium-transporting ATPase (P-type)
MSSGEISSLEMSSGEYVNPNDETARGLSIFVILLSFITFILYMVLMGKASRGYSGGIFVKKITTALFLGLIITTFLMMVPAIYLSDCLIGMKCNESFKLVNLSIAVLTGLLLLLLIIGYALLKRRMQ